MVSLGTMKRGDTFSFTAAITDSVTAAAITGAAADLACNGRYAADGDIVVDMTISETETLGTYLFLAGSTVAWKPNYTINFDIEYTAGGVISTSETLTLVVEGDYTYD